MDGFEKIADGLVPFFLLLRLKGASLRYAPSLTPERDCLATARQTNKKANHGFSTITCLGSYRGRRGVPGISRPSGRCEGGGVMSVFL